MKKTVARLQLSPQGHYDDDGWNDQYSNLTTPSPTASQRPHSNDMHLGRHGQYASASKYNAVFSDDENDGPPMGHSMAGSSGRFTSLLPSMRSQPSGFLDPVQTSTAYHIHQAENALATLKQVVAEDGWKKALKHKSGVVVHMKNGTSKTDKTPIFKGHALIHGFSPQSIFYVIGMRKLWDEHYEDGNLIENLNETTSLTYELSKPTSTSKPRDLSLVEKIECTQDGAIIFACTSVESPRIPRMTGRVRANIKLQGWILEPVRGGPTPATHVTYVIQESMKGWVPGFAKKSLARRPLVIALVNDYLQRKAERMRSQKKPGLSNRQTGSKPSLITTHLDPRSASSLQIHTSPSIRSINSSPSPTLSQRSILLGPSAAAATPAAANPTTKKKITFAEHDITYSAESLIDDQSSVNSQIKPANNVVVPRPASRHLYPTHRHPDIRLASMNSLKRLSSSLEGWTLRGERNGFKMYTQYVNDRLLPLLRSDGEIKGGWTAEQLCSVIHCIGARKKWDERFENGRVVERFSQKEYLVQWWLKSMFPMDDCDAAVITSLETESTTGVIYTASASVNDTQIPPDPSGRLVRSHVELYGWVFSPVLDAKGRTQSVNVTMVWDMDYRSRQPVPDNTAQVLCDEMLNSVANVDQYLKNYGCPPYIRRVAGKVVNEEFEAKTRTYQITYIAKHEPSSSYRARKPNAGQTWCTDIRFHRSTYGDGLDVKLTPADGTRFEMSQDNRSMRIYTTTPAMEGKHVTVTVTATVRATPKKVSTATLAPPVATAPAPAAAPVVAPATVPAAAPVADTTSDTVQRSIPPVTEQAHSQALPKPSIPGALEVPKPGAETLHPLQSHTSNEAKHDAQTISSPASTPRTSAVSMQVPEGYMLVPQNHQSNNIIIISDELTFNGQQLAVVFIAMMLCYYMGKFACTC